MLIVVYQVLVDDVIDVLKDRICHFTSGIYDLEYDPLSHVLKGHIYFHFTSDRLDPLIPGDDMTEKHKLGPIHHAVDVPVYLTQ